ncbi:hypothetical protein B0H11DRAFT_2221172 [Mycena galericulata]|nr:hypothetical protein B0H11DRAFT_2221172 [Mycena galericulata]
MLSMYMSKRTGTGVFSPPPSVSASCLPPESERAGGTTSAPIRSPATRYLCIAPAGHLNAPGMQLPPPPPSTTLSHPPRIQTRRGCIRAPAPSTSIPRLPRVQTSGGITPAPARSPASLYLHLRSLPPSSPSLHLPLARDSTPTSHPPRIQMRQGCIPHDRRARPVSERVGGATPAPFAPPPPSASGPPRVRTSGVSNSHPPLSGAYQLIYAYPPGHNVDEGGQNLVPALKSECGALKLGAN